MHILLCSLGIILAQDKFEMVSSSEEKASALAKNGFTLKYQGARYTPSSFVEGCFIDRSDEFTPLQALADRFSNLGALVIRYHIGQGQRAGLLQQVSKSTYALNPVEKPAKGADDAALFFDATDLNVVGQTYEFASHLSLGRSKLLNERAQPLVHVNKHELYGEQAIWDIIHAPLWNVGRTMQFELDRQGFSYIHSPAHLCSDKRTALIAALGASTTPSIKILKSYEVDATPVKIQELEICLDDKKEYTQEANSLAIKVARTDDDFLPLGWIIHQPTGQILPQFITEDIIRVAAIAKGGFYEKTPGQQKILQSGNLKNTTGLGLFTQNQAFNAMYAIFDFLEQFGFDPRPLLDKSLSIAYQRLQKKCSDEPEIIDDFLVGALQAEMVQPLRVSQAHSQRSILPLRFTNPFKVSLNNIKAIAYAFNLRDQSGVPIFKAYDDSTVTHATTEHLDHVVNGQLAFPSFNTASSVAVILSTSALVSEQLLLEQLLSEAVLHPTGSLFSQICISILGETEGPLFCDAMIAATSDFPADGGRFILGAQFEYCQPLLRQLREGLQLEQLPMLVALFANPEASTAEVVECLDGASKEQLTNIVRNLYKIGTLMQRSPLTTGEPEYSRGIIAGLEPLIIRLAPALAAELGIVVTEAFVTTIPPIDKERVRDRVSIQAYTKCPFLAGRRPATSTISTEKREASMSRAPASGRSWNFFCSQVLPACAVGVTIAAGIVGVLINSRTNKV